MMHMRFSFRALLICFLMNVFVSPMIASAQGAEMPFGGMHLFSTQCTCASDSLEYILDYRTNKVLSLLYEPGRSRLYSNNNVKAMYQLGTYQITGQQCMIQSGNSCTSINADGTYGTLPGTGTSFLTSIRLFASALSPVFRIIDLQGIFFNPLSDIPAGIVL